MQEDIYYSKEWDQGLEDTPEEWQNIVEEYSKLINNAWEE